MAAWLLFFWTTLSSFFIGQKLAWIFYSTLGIIAGSLYLIYEKRNLFAKTFYVSSQLGLVAIFLLSIGFIMGDISHIQYVKLSAVTCMLPAIVMTAFGPMVVKELFFPLIFLMFVIPLQDEGLANRSVIAWIALASFVAYYLFTKIVKIKSAIVIERPVWFYQNSRWLVPSAIAFSMLMASPWLGENIRTLYPEKAKLISLRAPLGVKGWTGPFSVRTQSWAPIYSNASSTLQAEYYPAATGSEEGIYLYTAYYSSDRPFSEVLSPKNSIFNPGLWKQTSLGQREIDLGNGESMTVYEAVLIAGTAPRLVWYWYYVAGVNTIDNSVSNVMNAVRLISKYAQGSGVIILSASFDTTPSEATKRLQAFIKVMYGSLAELKRPEVISTQESHPGT